MTDADDRQLSEWAARHDVQFLLRQLPWSEKVELTLPAYDEMDSGVAWIKTIESWLAEYKQIVALAKSSAAEMATELAELRDQRAAVRSFFGTTDRTQ